MPYSAVPALAQPPSGVLPRGRSRWACVVLPYFLASWGRAAVGFAALDQVRSPPPVPGARAAAVSGRPDLVPAGRLRLGGPPPVALLAKSQKFDDEQFDEILAELEADAASADGEYEEPEDPFAWFKETFGWVLVVDIFIIIFLSLWFLLGVFLKYVAAQEGVLNVFLLGWDPYFQSLLGILFAARATAIFLNWIMGGGDP
mmetsp:Transcript_1168/g.2769  ORF Transcript_1168/g.2769 Transcript_1168/m.2769 type:complete len:201 (-) Transcript_1168:118-720(-)|eukprot:CAMPEP_0197895134 /NCGR_PEP_ID=MMETSP1439-20131203/36587_1 /TAXON_ID=66791 /ORGANISM="Gonyaulax spinifera, Strain CCMP409" /LENGTH=200 /DNA_ID=CAMNT_0043515551 /DNA_START=69 /DNA_END=671 /DNA_ORIENTATION=-